MKIEKNSKLETFLAGAAIGMFVMMFARGSERLWGSYERFKVEKLHASNDALKKARQEMIDIQIRQASKRTRYS